MEPYIVNVVIKYKLLGAIDTSSFQKANNFSGYTLKDGKKTGRVYENGIVIVTGVKSVADGDKFIRLHFSNNPIITRNVKNITASGRLPYCVSSFRLFSWHQQNIDISPFSYESEIFPAIYWAGEPETVYFFPSGAVIITGLKSLARLDPVWEHLLEDINTALKSI